MICFVQDEDSEAVLAADFEIGHFIRERIVPRAVLYFTGEAIEDDDDDVSEQDILCHKVKCFISKHLTSVFLLHSPV